MSFMDKDHLQDLKERAKYRLRVAQMRGLGPSGLPRPKRQKERMLERYGAAAMKGL